jgi:hypothetical protein
VRKAVCKAGSGGYLLSTKAVIGDSKCVEYYATSELQDASLTLSRYPGRSTLAETQIGAGATGTLDNYYKVHKAAGGTYFAEPSSGRNYYKVGNYFYVAFGDATGVYEKYKAGRESACANEDPNFRQVFVNAMSTLKEL